MIPWRNVEVYGAVISIMIIQTEADRKINLARFFVSAINIDYYTKRAWNMTKMVAHS